MTTIGALGRHESQNLHDTAVQRLENAVFSREDGITQGAYDRTERARLETRAALAPSALGYGGYARARIDVDVVGGPAFSLEEAATITPNAHRGTKAFARVERIKATLAAGAASRQFKRLQLADAARAILVPPPKTVDLSVYSRSQ